VGAHYPGRSANVPLRLEGSEGSSMRWQKSAEAVVGGNTEGPNNEAESRTDGLETKR